MEKRRLLPQSAHLSHTESKFSSTFDDLNLTPLVSTFDSVPLQKMTQPIICSQLSTHSRPVEQHNQPHSLRPNELIYWHPSRGLLYVCTVCVFRRDTGGARSVHLYPTPKHTHMLEGPVESQSPCTQLQRNNKRKRPPIHCCAHHATGPIYDFAVPSLSSATVQQKTYTRRQKADEKANRRTTSRKDVRVCQRPSSICFMN